MCACVCIYVYIIVCQLHYLATDNTLINYSWDTVLNYLYDVDATGKLILPCGKRSEDRVNRKSDP